MIQNPQNQISQNMKKENINSVKKALDEKIKNILKLKDLMNKEPHKRTFEDIKDLVNIISGLQFFKEMSSLTMLDLKALAFCFQI